MESDIDPGKGSPAEQVTVSHGSMCVLCVQFCVTVIPTLFVEETFVR